MSLEIIDQIVDRNFGAITQKKNSSDSDHVAIISEF
jgi:hypothetical protein